MISDLEIDSLEIQYWYHMEKKAYHYPTKNMTFLVPIPLHHFRWPKSFFHDLANACVRYANKWLHLCPFVCLYTLFILSYCRVALERMSPFLLLKSNVFPDYKIIFSQTLNKNIVLFHLENAEFCILIQAWTILYFAFTT